MSALRAQEDSDGETSGINLKLDITVLGDPKSKARARWTPKGQVYTPEPTRTAEEILAMLSRTSIQGDRDEDVRTAYGVELAFFTKNYQRRDIDNMTKLVLDGLTKGGVWRDDSQVTELVARTVHADPNPRTEIKVYRAGFIGWPTTLCKVCGTSTRTYRSNRGSRERVYCSKECRAFDKAAQVVALICATCQLPFTRARHESVRNVDGNRYCSVVCKQVASGRKSGLVRQMPTPQCSECGAVLSKRGYERCRACWRRKPIRLTT